LAMTGMVNGTTYNCTTIAHLSDGTSSLPSAPVAFAPKASMAIPVPMLGQTGVLLMTVLTGILGLAAIQRHKKWGCG
ncbi:hypothetical protein ACFIQG_20615, partial [Comamonas odontotermitis]|uniref:hypothetical protein n=1 Tax=Comamonas odontotermitis TaxID=379895 RepID=UPI0036733CFC